MLLRDLPRLYILQDPLARGPAAEASSLAGLFNKTNSAEDKHAPLSEHYVTIKSLCLKELFYLPIPGRIYSELQNVWRKFMLFYYLFKTESFKLDEYLLRVLTTTG